MMMSNPKQVGGKGTTPQAKRTPCSKWLCVTAAQWRMSGRDEAKDKGGIKFYRAFCFMLYCPNFKLKAMWRF
jgi:hypothetical protein